MYYNFLQLCMLCKLLCRYLIPFKPIFLPILFFLCYVLFAFSEAFCGRKENQICKSKRVYIVILVVTTQKKNY